MSHSTARKKSRPRGCSFLTLVLIIAPFLALFLCGLGLVFLSRIDSEVTSQQGPGYVEPGTLRVAYSPEKAELFNRLATGFNNEEFMTTEGHPMRIQAIETEPDEMIRAATNAELQAVSPDSSIWLDQIDRNWMAGEQTDSGLVGSTFRYAVSPVVIAAWEDVARSMGYPDRRLGWDDVIDKATSDPDFKWSHPSTGSASGLLATLAMFYAGADKTRGLTIQDVTAESTLEFVSAVQKTVRQYGEGERAVMQQVVDQGPGYLDAFVVSEQLVIQYNTGSNPEDLVAIYPREGTLWEDHPLALLETPDLRPDQRAVFQKFREYLASQASQQEILSQGFRPTDLGIPLIGVHSPVSLANGVDPTEPQTALQIPSAAVVEIVRDVWWYTKRKTNVFLVADTSGSMEGDKLEAAREAMDAFIAQIKGADERVGLVTFASHVNNIIQLGSLSENRVALSNEIQLMQAGGDTALLDAVRAAYVRLQELNDNERINAIVAMTDGRENNSRVSLSSLAADIRKGNEFGVPVVVFCVAYGSDADYGMLEALAEAGEGQVRQGDPDTIRDLYKILSTYF